MNSCYYLLNFFDFFNLRNLNCLFFLEISNILIIWLLTYMKPCNEVHGYLSIYLLKFRRIYCPAERYEYFLFLDD